jgi:hypothetical protein
MIIGGGSRCNWRWFSRHLMNGRDNEVVRVAEIRGLPADTLIDAFQEMKLIASAAPQCKNFFYHADLNTRAEELLTEEQWDAAVDTLEKNLGLESQPRVVIEHDKNGRVHRHVLWSRIDPDTLTVISDSHNYDVHMRTADELEKEFGHARTERGRGPDGRNPDNWEVFRGKKSGIDPYHVKAELRDLWHQADTPQAFAAALEEHSYILCEGDRGLCVVDESAKEHSLYRRLALKKKEIDARMADIDRDGLPSVAEARAIARERLDEQEDRDGRQEADPADDKKRDGRLASLAEDVAETVQHALKRQEHSADMSPPGEESPGAGENTPLEHSGDAPQTPEAAPALSSAFDETPATVGDAHTGPADAAMEPPVAERPGAADRPAPAPYAVSVPELERQAARGRRKPEPRSTPEPYVPIGVRPDKPEPAPYAASVPEPDPAAAKRPATEPRSRPQPHIPIARRQPSLFDRLRDSLARGTEWLRGEPTIAESAQPAEKTGPRAEYRARASCEPALPEPVLADSALTRFERMAGELAQEVKPGGPAVAEIAVTAAAVAAIAAPALSEFERVTKECTDAAHAGGSSDRSMTEGLNWLAGTVPPASAPPPGNVPMPFDRVTADLHDAVRNNGGEPEPGFWQRSVALLALARDGLLEWAKETARSFAERIRQSRDRGDRDGPGLER